MSCRRHKQGGQNSNLTSDVISFRGFAMLNFQQVVSVNFQGVVVVFGRPATGTLTDIYFNVLGQDFDINDDALAWSGFTSLEFPGQVRQIGMSLITLKKDGDTMTPAAAPPLRRASAESLGGSWLHWPLSHQ